MIDWKWVGIIVGVTAVIAVIIWGWSAYRGRDLSATKTNSSLQTDLGNLININPVISNNATKSTKSANSNGQYTPSNSSANQASPPTNQTPWQQGPSIPPVNQTPWGQGPS